MNLPTISQDKALHAIYGYWTFTLVVAFAALVIAIPAAFLLGAAATVAVAVGRELWQHVTGNGHVDAWDVWATIGGGAAGAFAMGAMLAILGL